MKTLFLVDNQIIPIELNHTHFTFFDNYVYDETPIETFDITTSEFNDGVECYNVYVKIHEAVNAIVINTNIIPYTQMSKLVTEFCRFLPNALIHWLQLKLNENEERIIEIVTTQTKIPIIKDTIMDFYAYSSYTSMERWAEFYKGNVVKWLTKTKMINVEQIQKMIGAAASNNSIEVCRILCNYELQMTFQGLLNIINKAAKHGAFEGVMYLYDLICEKYPDKITPQINQDLMSNVVEGKDNDSFNWLCKKLKDQIDFNLVAIECCRHNHPLFKWLHENKYINAANNVNFAKTAALYHSFEVFQFIFSISNEFTNETFPRNEWNMYSYVYRYYFSLM
jgi:hypothetical protein